jgi:hypothetical protein
MKPMSKKRIKLSDQVRKAVDASKISRYAICQVTGIDQAALSRFMAAAPGGRGLNMKTLDALADVLDLNIVAGRKAGKR